MNQRYQQLKQIKDAVLSLADSPLFEYRKKHHYLPVIGEGSHQAEIMFVGEAPGENEAKTGRPFCGAAGRVLNDFLAQAGLSRKDVYITNIVKDRPPGNRDPSEKEIEIYSPFLIKQIEVIQPKIIATLGRFAMSFMMKNYNLEEKMGKISSIHGKVFSTKLDYGQIYLVPLYHPAVALYQHSMKKILENDFQVLTTIDSLA